MPVTFNIFANRGLVYVTLSGHVTVAESARAFEDYANHPDCRPGQKQLVDMTDLTSFSQDFIDMMKLRARMADVFLAENAQTLLVYLAPNPVAMELCKTFLPAWNDDIGFVPIVQQNEADALALLGQPETSIASLMGAVG